jgi:hydrogenase maturation protease
MRTRIICVGNELVCDDGVGMRVGRVLQKLSLGDGVSVEFHPQVSLDLIDAVLESERIVLVDATQTGQEPGTCSLMTGEQVGALAGSMFCCHGVGLPDLLLLASKLEPTAVVPEVRLVGVEAAVLDQFGTSLSPAVQKALPDAVEHTLRLVGASEQLVVEGRRLAVELAPWCPEPIEAYGG